MLSIRKLIKTVICSDVNHTINVDMLAVWTWNEHFYLGLVCVERWQVVCKLVLSSCTCVSCSHNCSLYQVEHQNNQTNTFCCFCAYNVVISNEQKSSILICTGHNSSKDLVSYSMYFVRFVRRPVLLFLLFVQTNYKEIINFLQKS